jgi:tetratricopeptide (TPR) repeat protein
MVQRQVILFLAAVAVVSISLFLFFQLKRSFSANSNAVGIVNQPPDDESNGPWRTNESSQSESAAQDSPVSAAGVEKTTEEAAQPVAWSPSTQGFVGSAACAECHQDLMDSYKKHPMIIRNRSISSADRSSPVDQGEFVFRETDQMPDLEKRRAIAITQVKTGLASTKLVEELQYLRSQFPQDGFLALALGAASVSRKDYPIALESLQQAAACPQTEELALEVLTQVTYFAQDWPNAFKSMDMYLRLNPYRSQTMAIKADALFRTGQTQRSIDVAKEALRHNPSLIEVHQWLRDTYQKLGRIPEAEAESAILERMKTAKPPRMKDEG